MSSPHQDSLLPRFAQGEEGHETTTKFPCLVCVDRKRLARTVLIFTESSDQLSRATDRVPGLPASPGYVQ
ncbi:TPA: hypothetical protein IDZ30_004997 [Escherichia coli]|nr:hypothetical protein [Escherichia coli]